MPPYNSYFGGYCHLPIFPVDINSYENLLSFERNFVPLHTGTILVGYCILFTWQLQRYNPIIIVPTFSTLFLYLICIFTFFLVILHRSRTRKRALLRSNPPATWLCPHWKQCFKSRPAHGRLTDSWWASRLRKPYQHTGRICVSLIGFTGGRFRLCRVCVCKHSNFIHISEG